MCPIHPMLQLCNLHQGRAPALYFLLLAPVWLLDSTETYKLKEWATVRSGDSGIWYTRKCKCQSHWWRLKHWNGEGFFKQTFDGSLCTICQVHFTIPILTILQHFNSKCCFLATVWSSPYYSVALCSGVPQSNLSRLVLGQLSVPCAFSFAQAHASAA